MVSCHPNLSPYGIRMHRSEEFPYHAGAAMCCRFCHSWTAIYTVAVRSLAAIPGMEALAR